LATPKADVPNDSVVQPGMSVSDPSVPDAGGTIKPDSSSLAPKIAPTVAPAKAGFLSRRKTKAPAKADPPKAATPAATVAGSEAERMTVFGARNKNVGGKPRFLGLILTAALLVFLAGVAAWASVFLDDGISLSKLFGERTPRVTASIPDPPKAEEQGVRTASLDPGLTEEDTAVLDALRDPGEPPAEILTEAEAEAKYAATGIWPRAPQVPPEPAGLIDIEDLYVTSIDPVSTTTDAVALPTSVSFLTDTGFGTVTSPAAAGTTFAYDARGLIIPTAQGALSPDGFTVFLGRPDVVPTGLPDRSEVVVAEAETDNELAKVRPRLRPSDLAETTERAQLDGLTKSELAGYRPTLRPASIQQQAAAIAAAAEVAAAETPTVDTSDAVAAALAAETAPAIENATRFAVRASVRPDTRPRNFARIVKRAQRAAPAQETQVAAVAPRVVTPKIPTKTSVARQATVKNALNLRKVNLIGVYGKPSSRRALVRLGNGRYKKVVVGDRIDGGRVSAIGDGELRYNKRGRAVVLKMPKG
jgi:DNA-binding transcriptional regulator YdaS (Cro superfamily)